MFKILLRLMKFSGRHNKDLIKGFLYNFLFTVFEVLTFVAIILTLKTAIIWVGNNTMVSYLDIGKVFIIMCIGLIGKIIFGSLANSKISFVCFNMCMDKRISIGNKLKRMPMGFFSKSRLGEITSIATTTINDIEEQFSHLFTNIIVSLAYTLVVSVVMIFMEWRIGVFSVIAIIIGLIINNLLQKHSKIVSPKRQKAQNSLINAVLEYVQGISVIKAFGMGDVSSRSINGAIEESRVKNLALESILGKIVSLYIYVFKLASCIQILIACYLLSIGEFSIFKTLMVIISSFVIFTKIENLGGAASFLQIIDENIAKVQTIEDFPLIDEGAMAIEPLNYNINFKNCSFSYDKRKILQNINLEIMEGETVAIVGPSGSGKTTICNLITRFWDIDEGEITLGGHNIKKYTCESLLTNISMVFQKVYLFNDTILNNITFAKPEATMSEVHEAAKKACCHEFIISLPMGYETVVGEGGSSLSGGEKQRISIARAILKDAPIIILDEATSSVDPINQRKIQKGIEELTKEKTVIMIAHRLSTVQKADNIFVLNQGNIIQRGKHEDLVKEEGLYKDFIILRKSAANWNL